MTRRLSLCVVMVALVAPGLAVAQAPRPAAAPPVQSLLQGGQDKDQPVQIEAASLEVRDKNKMATFSGDVQVVQGDTTMKCQKLVVFYGQEVGIAQAGAQAGAPAPDAKPAPTSALPGPKGAQNIRRIEARGGVTVITKDQNASGDLGVYDLIAKTITLTGNVVVSQGQNVIHGERVVVDTVTGNARVESNNQGGGATPSRVRALIQPNQGQNGGGGNVMTIGPGAPAAPGKPN
ncbi:MAG TPA: LptA/OstA family protein [Xanthobacteraceae bacterium]|jgi:lipopolysaccharide export system protein LptA|nr:LptA/OstA family protein [Xanthobacteraceae bacterium]